MSEQAQNETTAAGMEAINAFFANWKTRATSYYMSRLAKRAELVKAKNDLRDKFGLHCVSPWTVIPAEFKAAAQALADFLASLTAGERDLLEKMNYAEKCEKNGSAASVLDAYLTKDVETRKAQFIARVEKKAGKIVNALALGFGCNGELNGFVVGTVKSVYVETIVAGGYNVQCLHYRVLVK